MESNSAFVTVRLVLCEAVIFALRVERHSLRYIMLKLVWLPALSDHHRPQLSWMRGGGGDLSVRSRLGRAGDGALVDGLPLNFGGGWGVLLSSLLRSAAEGFGMEEEDVFSLSLPWRAEGHFVGGEGCFGT